MTTRRRAGVAMIATLVLVLSGCTLSLPFSLGFGGGSDGRFDGTETTVPVLYASGSSGGVTSQRITATSAEGAGLSIDITENDVSGVDAITQASVWTAVTAATLLTGARPDTAYTFGFDARISTPAAGAVTAVGVLALYYDTEVQPGVALTGTVTPLGTIGPVAGLPEQISAAIEAGGIDTILVPAGQRTARDATGTAVDLDQLAATGGMTVAEVSDIAGAYAVVTGEDLPEATFPTPPPSPTPLATVDAPDDELGAMAGGLGGLVGALDARFRAAEGGLPTAERPALAEDAVAAAQRAADLRAGGDDGGAFAALASALDLAAAATVDTATVAEAERTADDGESVLRSLVSAPPTSLDDADALLRAYSAGVDAVALARYAQTALADTDADVVAAGTAAAAMAAAAVETATAVAAIRPVSGNGPVADGADLAGVASLLRRAAVATADAVDSAVIAPRATADAVSDDVAAARLAADDPDLLRLVALAASRDELAALAAEDDGGWSALGVATSSYTRSIPVLEAARPAGLLPDDADAAERQRVAVADEYSARAVDALRAAGADVGFTAGALSDAFARVAAASGADDGGGRVIRALHARVRDGAGARFRRRARAVLSPPAPARG